ncbi:MAG: hypothetical protein RR496_00180 [Lachnospiraceae bacterium]
MALSEELSTILKRYGAKSVGYGKLDGEISCGYEVGVSVILPVPVSIIKEIKNGPTKAYYDMYYEWNQRLDQMVKMGEQFLIQQGYAAFAQTTQVVEKKWTVGNTGIWVCCSDFFLDYKCTTPLQ